MLTFVTFFFNSTVVLNSNAFITIALTMVISFGSLRSLTNLEILLLESRMIYYHRTASEYKILSITIHVNEILLTLKENTLKKRLLPVKCKGREIILSSLVFKLLAVHKFAIRNAMQTANSNLLNPR